MYRKAIDFIISVFASILATLIYVYAQDKWTSLDVEKIEYAAYFAITLIFFYYFLPYLSSYGNQILFGKMRGLWSGRYLDRQILKNYQKSEEIKIKVTRSYNLFLNKNNTNFYICINDQKLNNKPRKIKLLMHYPCKLSKHVQERAKTHGTDIDSFLETWLQVVVALAERIHSSPENKTSVEMRFYPNAHERWRFFWFNKKNHQVALLNYYDADSSGDRMPMHMVDSGNGSLCDKMNKYFDEIWNSESVCSIEFLLNWFGRKNNQLAKCGKCRYQEDCARLGEKYGVALSNASKFYPSQ